MSKIQAHRKIRISRRALCTGALALVLRPTTTWSADAATHAIAMHGAPKHSAGFTAFPYVNPAAPKGGRIRLGVLGNFDSLNPLIYKGESASGIRDYVYESLLDRSADEPFTLYGHLASGIIMPDDRQSITFELRAEARFSDGTPLTSADIAFSHSLLRDKGWPFMRRSYGEVAKVTVTDAHTVRFDFNPGSDRELALLMGLMPIVSKARIDPATFEQTTLIPPIGTGPYRVAELEAGRYITYRRDPAWWAAALPHSKGQHNFDEIRFDFYRDANAMFESFKSGDIDIVTEDDPSRWARGYDFPAAQDGRVIKRVLDLKLPAPMSALVCNTRRPVFADIRVRRALNFLFDGEWINANLFAGLLTRTGSFFARSELSSYGRPPTPRERELLAPFTKLIDPDILNGTWQLPKSDGSGSNRDNQRKAFALLRDAGFVLNDGTMTNTKTLEPLAFEVLLNSRGQERLVLTYTTALAALGIKATVRLVDSAQYELRLKSQDFDMIQTAWQSSLSPGNEQRNRWSSASADADNTRNYASVKNPAVDAMIDAMVEARTAENFTAAVRAFDRALLSGHYIIPLFYADKRWVAHWSHLAGPKIDADNITNAGIELDTWWSVGSRAPQ